MFIELTRIFDGGHKQQKVLFNINNYDSIYIRDDGVTILDKLGSETYEILKETPEEIIEKINDDIKAEATITRRAQITTEFEYV
jgi:translation elongation factor P/translation initiation factor 5A